MDLEGLWVAFPNDIHEGPLHANCQASPVVLLHAIIVAGISIGSFAMPAQYEYKLVVTRVGI